MKKVSLKNVFFLFGLIIVILICVAFFIQYLKQKREIPIVLSFDDNYAVGALVTIASSVENADKKDQLIFYVLEKNISPFYKEQIEKLRKEKPFQIHYIRADHLLPDYLNSNSTYYRYLLGHLFSNHKKIIWLDTDLYVLSSLWPLYNQNIDGKYVAAIEDMHSTRHLISDITKIFNAGVMLINIDMWNNNQILEKAIDKKLFKRYKNKQKDQHVVNHLFKENIVWLPPMYNFHHSCLSKKEVYCYDGKNHFSAQELRDAQKNMKIYHYIIEGKPWKIGPDYILTTQFFKTLERYFNGYWVDDETILFRLNNQEVFKFPNGLRGKIVDDQNGILKIIFDDETIQYLSLQNYRGVNEYQVRQPHN